MLLKVEIPVFHQLAPEILPLNLIAVVRFNIKLSVAAYVVQMFSNR